jgi:feruloyl esterase
LTASQVAALKKMYAGPKNPRTGEQIYPGWPQSSEALTVGPDGLPISGWNRYWGTTEPARANFWRYWVFNDPKWNWWNFDFDRDLALAGSKVGGMVDQVNANITAFKARGGKAIVYQGWQDPVVNPIDTIAYYERVRAAQGSRKETETFFRLFLVPGMGHCAGGTGATDFGGPGAPSPGHSPITDPEHDILAALDTWVERGIAPEKIIASKVVSGATLRTRPLCPYPQKAMYTGTGDTDNAVNFRCRE